jgi:hypothetical protein
VWYEYRNAANKVYTHIINKTWLYEQPQSTKPFPERVNVPNASIEDLANEPKHFDKTHCAITHFRFESNNPKIC